MWVAESPDVPELILESGSFDAPGGCGIMANGIMKTVSVTFLSEKAEYIAYRC